MPILAEGGDETKRIGKFTPRLRRGFAGSALDGIGIVSDSDQPPRTLESFLGSALTGGLFQLGGGPHGPVEEVVVSHETPSQTGLWEG
jgi:hypothetical protein